MELAAKRGFPSQIGGAIALRVTLMNNTNTSPIGHHFTLSNLEYCQNIREHVKATIYTSDCPRESKEGTRFVECSVRSSVVVWCSTE